MARYALGQSARKLTHFKVLSHMQWHRVREASWSAAALRRSTGTQHYFFHGGTPASGTARFKSTANEPNPAVTVRRNSAISKWNWYYKISSRTCH